MYREEKRMIYIICAVVAALLVAVLLYFTVFGGGRNRKYARCYSEAEDAFLAGDYDTSLEKINRAMELKTTEEAYLLTADVYYAQNDIDRAVQVLYLGYSRIGSDRIAQMLENLKQLQGGGRLVVQSTGSVTIAGETVDANATSLVLTGRSLTPSDLAGLAELTELDNLILSGSGIRDLSPLSGMRKLTFLQISDNAISDLLPLAGLSELKTLYLDNNPVTDLTPLYALTGLRTLSMKGIALTVSQLNALQKSLPNCSIYTDTADEEAPELTLGGKKFRADVTELNLAGLDIDDISVLRQCTMLEKLDLRDNRISDISPLVDLQNLHWLCLWGNEVSDIRPLMSLNKLEYLDVDGNQITDISVVQYLPDLEELWLSNNRPKSLEPLKALTGLIRLGLKNVGLTDADLDLLKGLTSLKELTIQGNGTLSSRKFQELRTALPDCAIAHDELREVITLEGKEYTVNGTALSAAGKGIQSLLGIEKGAKLTSADLSGNQISDLAPLASCTKLTSLSLSNNAIVSITPLAACTGLTVLDLSWNRIDSLDGLSGLTGLQTLNLANNDVSDLSALYALTGLTELDLCGNPLTEDDILALETMLPDCTIRHDVAEPTPSPEP